MNNLLRYTGREFDSIKEDLVSMINSVSSEWTNREESDPGMMLINVMAALGDNLSFNMDMQTLELYLSTVTQRKNCKKLLQLGGYKMHWYRSAVTNVTILNNSLSSTLLMNMDMTDNSNNMTLLASDSNVTYTLFVPENLNNGNQNIKEVRINSQGMASFVAVEGKLKQTTVPITSINNNRFYISDTTIDESHIFLYDPNSQLYWTLVEDLALVNEKGRYFEFNIDEYENPYIQLVSYWDKYFDMDRNSSDLQLYYISSSGSAGSVGNNAFSYIIGTPSLVGNSSESVSYSITNYSNQFGTLASGNSPGYDPQSVTDAKADYVNYINTYNTLVTLYDFEKFIRRQSGFSIAKAIDAQKAAELNDVVFRSFDDGDDEDLGSSTHYLVPTLQMDIANLSRYRKYVFGGEYVYDVDSLNNNKDTVGYSYTNSKSIKNYTLNIYTVYMNYDQRYNDIEDPNYWNYPTKLPYDPEFGFTEIAELEGMGVGEGEDNFFNKFHTTFTRRAPFRRYKVSDIVVNSIQKRLDSTKVITVDVQFPECRVFDWRVKGTLYLYEPVSKSESESIISTVIDALAATFTPEYVGFGNKIRYMDVIDVITNCDQRIRYFDAGYGTEPLIDYADCFDVTNYFNDISIMRFNQYSVPSTADVAPQYNRDENDKPLIYVDASCIKEEEEILYDA